MSKSKKSKPTTQNNRKAKNSKEMIKDLSFTLSSNPLDCKQRKFDTTEIGRGVGIIQSKKGKGSYNRKNSKSCDYHLHNNKQSICI